MRSIKLEILRKGPPHNQLLSPLTEYIALLGDHPPATVRVDAEHGSFLTRLQGLRYDRGAQVQRRLAMDDLAKLMMTILDQIPGLPTELGAQQGQPVQLRLVLSGLELAMLPFELALAPDGFPTAQQWLFRQDLQPVYLTREARRGQEATQQWSNRDWPERPRVLYAFSGAGGAVPFRAHLKALGEALDPWIGWLESREKELGDHIQVLPNASIASIQQKCRENVYNYVHILCHGAPLPHAPDRFGLALFTEDLSGVDVVEGERLAAALMQQNGALPTVVTLSSCDSGATGTVLTGEASVAHALHGAGVSLVVASQFPLTSLGSERFAKEFYGQVLRGKDPRKVIHDVRRILFVQAREDHDWASLVIYATFPKNLDSELPLVELRRWQKEGDVILKRLERLWVGDPNGVLREDAKILIERLDRVVNEVEVFLTERNTEHRAHAWLAAAAMRWVVEAGCMGVTEEQEFVGREKNGSRPLSSCGRKLALEKAIFHYRTAHAVEPEEIGSVVGELVARAVLLAFAGSSASLKPDIRMVQGICKRLLPQAAQTAETVSAAALHGYLGLMAVLSGKSGLRYFIKMFETTNAASFAPFSMGRSLRRLRDHANEEIKVQAEESWKMLAEKGTPTEWYEATSWWKPTR